MVKLEGGGWTTETVALPGRARHPGLRPPGPDAADACMRSAATACRAVTTKPPPRCSATRASCRTPAPPCWCSRWCPPRWRPRSRRRTHAAAPPSASAPARGTAGQVLVLHDMLGIGARPQAALRAQLHGRGRPASRRPSRRYVARRQGRQLSRRPTAHATEAARSHPCTSSTPSPTCAHALGRLPRAAPSCRPWATCTTATSPWCAQARPLGDVDGRQHLRQPPAVPAARGLRHATRARWDRDCEKLQRGRLRRAVRARRTRALSRAADLQGASRPRARRHPRRRLPARLLHRRLHRGDEAVPCVQPARGACSARRTTSS